MRETCQSQSQMTHKSRLDLINAYVAFELLRLSSHLQSTALNFLSLRQPANLLQLLTERRNFLLFFFTADENVENGFLLDCHCTNIKIFKN